MQPLHELTNGRYKLRISDAGGGQSMWDWIALNRWPGDAVEDAHGFFIYLRDCDSGALWSAGLQPTVTKPDRCKISRTPEQFVIERSDAGILCRMEVHVDKTADLEVRRVILKNETRRARRIELTSCIEIALAHPMGDLGHPAFSKLFVQTAWLPSCHTLVAKRRPRAHGEAWPAMFHALSGAAPVAHETDRLLFIGRGRSLARPAAIMRGTTGNVLDPVFSLRTIVGLAAGESREVSFLLGAVGDHSQLEAIITRHQEPAGARREPDVACGPSVPPSPESTRSHFSPDGDEYVIHMPWERDALRLPPMPWCNVIANERFGFITSETGAGCSWSRNSQANRLTPWSNDPVCDPHGEALYLRDDESGAAWSPLPGPRPAAAEYEMAHGFGYSRCRVIAHGLEHETTLFVPRAGAVKLVRLRVKNTGVRERVLSLFSFHRLVLGTLPPPQGEIETRRDGDALLARNPKNTDFSDGTAFCLGVIDGVKVTQSGATCDRRSFIGENGSATAPRGLSAPLLDGCTDGAADPCFARQWSFIVPAGGALDFCLVLGEATGDDDLRVLRSRFSHLGGVDAALAEVKAFWRDLLGTVHVETPSPHIDLMVNGWLAYQAITCRMWGRTAFYQSSGAFGFRDQLQDAGNLTLLWPELTRQQIRLHARHQFSEGDVLHWWHEAPVGRGVRTRFSDDLLWLPFVTSEYVRATGDAALLDEREPFLEAPPLDPGEDESYQRPAVSDEFASIYEHCCRALERSLTRGAHGLPLMGTGDWNDGMNRVGREGRGESVWLGFFLFEILAHFIPLARRRGDEERAGRWRRYRDRLQSVLNDAGWDGAWYRRAYYDDGTPLGTKSADECRIDALAQSWAVLSGAAPAARAAQAMSEAEKLLIDERAGIIRLLTPPFENAREDPGYIKGYVAGVRENGGQYTHAACWMVRAVARQGRRDRAARLLEMLSPLWHASSPERLNCYKVEPYVIAADVYGAPPHVGRGGWTWYTGSAGWAWRVAVESVLGLRIENGDTLVLKPCVPDEWTSCRMRHRCTRTATTHHIHMRNPDGRAEQIACVSIDGVAAVVGDGEVRVPLFADGGEHQIVVTLGRAK
ncbi:MAG: glycosyl transferase [Verrucomicrobiaceae bacterium]|nr:glycosyl transferase [Verrucomicrobiaceae bacterium]